MAAADVLENKPRSLPRTAVCLFLGCLFLYHLNGRPHAGVDTAAAPYTAWALIRHGSLDLSRYPEMERYVDTAHIHQTEEGRWYSIRPIGSTLAVVPFVAPFAVFREKPLRTVNMNHLGKLGGACCVAGAVVVLFLLLRQWTPQAAWPATLLFAFGTSAWSVASQAIWMHGPAMFWLTLALYLLLPFRRELTFSRAALAGFALGMAVLCRPTAAVFALASGAPLLLGRSWRSLSGLVLGGAGPALLLIGMNVALYNDSVLGGYQNDNWHVQTPLWLGISGLLLAPSRGLLIYVPAFLLLPLAARSLLRSEALQRMSSRQRWTLLAWLLSALITIVFYAKWWCWYGGWCYGPRLLCETLPILCVLFALTYCALRSVITKRAAQGLIGLSIAVHAVGVFGHGAETGWYFRNERPDNGRWLFALRDTQIEAYGARVVGKLTKSSEAKPSKQITQR